MSKLILALLLAACLDSTPAADHRNSQVRMKEGNSLTQTDRAPVVVHLAGMSPGRPPLHRLSLDFELYNAAAEPRWFLLPHVMGGHRTKGGGVDTLEIVALGPKSVLGRFLGTGGFQAVRLAPGAVLKLRNVSVSHWGEPPSPLPVEVAVAREIRLGGKPAASWFRMDPTSQGGEADAKGQLLGSHKSQSGDEVKLELVDVQRFTVQVPLR